MFEPSVYSVCLFLMIGSMFCWGSWANTLKLCPSFRFQLFYWDYVIGLLLAAALWGATLGSTGGAGKTFYVDLSTADTAPIALAAASGAIFNVANLLLVAAIDIAGLAVAFPIGIGLALIIGAVSSYLIAPSGNPLLLFGGIGLVTGAIVLDAIAYRLRESRRDKLSKRGIVISLIAGVLMGCFYPLVSKAMSGELALGPYAAVAFFVVGVAISALPVNYLLMRRPLDGQRPAKMTAFWQAPMHWHLCGILGGVIWCTGTMANFVASRANVVGPAVSYSIGQGATMISAGWGVFVWREFSQAPKTSKAALVAMFILFLAGLASIAFAPLFQ